MPFALVITNGASAGQLYSLDSFAPLLVGRARDSDLVMPDDDVGISRYHAMLEVVRGGVSVRDMQGRMRTKINGYAVNSGTLRSGDRLTLGETDFVVRELSELPPEVIARSTNRKEDIATPGAETLGATLPPPGMDDDVSPSWFGPLGNLVPLRCTRCFVQGPLPPEPALAGAAWLCRMCIEASRELGPHDPNQLGEWEILRFIASGGMGQVYEAVATDTGLQAAVKVLLNDKRKSENAAQRFSREQRIAKAMRHPNIVRCFDTNVSSGRLYIATEYMVGGDAMSLARIDTPIHVVLSVGGDLFRALAFAHSLGVVHRDVKAQNLLLGARDERGVPNARLTDFGLAKSVRDLGLRPITGRGEAGGSMLMMSPEQLNNFSNPDPSCDVYSAAAVIYRLLTCSTHLVLTHSIQDANIHEVAKAILSKDRVPLNQRRPDVPDFVGEMIDGLLAREPTFRSAMTTTQIAELITEQAEQAIANAEF